MSYRLTMTLDTIRKTLVEVIEKVTGLPEGRVIREGYSDRRPKSGLYCTLWFRAVEPLVQNAGDWYFDDENELQQNLRNESICTVRIAFWGPRAYEKALETVGFLQNNQREFDLWRIMGYGGIDQVEDLSTAYLGKEQPRSQFNFTFHACLGAEYPADWFDTSQWVISLPQHNDYLQEETIPEQEDK